MFLLAKWAQNGSEFSSEAEINAVRIWSPSLTQQISEGSFPWALPTADAQRSSDLYPHDAYQEFAWNSCDALWW